jgi:hypothetical protein
MFVIIDMSKIEPVLDWNMRISENSFDLKIYNEKKYEIIYLKQKYTQLSIIQGQINRFAA